MNDARPFPAARTPSDRRSDRDLLVECADRTRRIETRFTRYLEQNGFDTQTRKAVFVDDHIQIPTPNIALSECLEAIPGYVTGAVEVRIGSEVITTLMVKAL